MDGQTKWIGVDLDGTLAEYKGWKGIQHIGKPIPRMVNRIKRWLREGRTVKIFTARVDNGPEAIKHIQDWAEKHIGTRLEVTNVKDLGCTAIWDDKGVRVQRNTAKQINKTARMEKREPLVPLKVVGSDGKVKAEIPSEVADTFKAKMIGMAKHSTAPGTGMLFDAAGPFWMRGMKFPLDIAFLTKSGEIVDIQHMPHTDKRKQYRSQDKRAAYALELPAGFSAQHKLAAGDRVDLGSMQKQGKDHTDAKVTAIGAGAGSALPLASLAQYHLWDKPRMRNMVEAAQEGAVSRGKLNPNKTNMTRFLKDMKPGDYVLEGGQRGHPLGFGSEVAFGVPSGHAIMRGPKNMMYDGGAYYDWLWDPGASEWNISYKVGKKTYKIPLNKYDTANWRYLARQNAEATPGWKKLPKRARNKIVTQHMSHAKDARKLVLKVEKLMNRGLVDETSFRQLWPHIKADFDLPTLKKLLQLTERKKPNDPRAIAEIAKGFKTSPDKIRKWLRRSGHVKPQKTHITDTVADFMETSKETMRKPPKPPADAGFWERFGHKFDTWRYNHLPHPTKGDPANVMTMLHFTPKEPYKANEVAALADMLEHEGHKKYNGLKAIWAGTRRVLAPHLPFRTLGKVCDPDTHICTTLPNTIARRFGRGGPNTGDMGMLFRNPHFSLTKVYNKPRFFQALKALSKHRTKLGLLAAGAGAGLGGLAAHSGYKIHNALHHPSLLERIREKLT